MPSIRLPGARCYRPVLIAGSLIAFILVVQMNALFNIPGISPFNVTMANLSHKYDTGITPSDGTFQIWGLIYLWHFALVIYGMTLLCRTADGVPLYLSPVFIPAKFFVFYIISLMGGPIWSVFFFQENLTAAFIVLVLTFLTADISFEKSCKQLDIAGAEMVKKGLNADIWCTRIILQNGVALYNAWLSCALLINAVIFVHYVLHFPMFYCCYAALVCLNILVLLWFISEVFICDHKQRYVFSHYIAYIAAFAGIHFKNYDPKVSYTVYALALWGLVVVLALIKLILIIVRGIRDPIVYPTNNLHCSTDKKAKLQSEANCKPVIHSIDEKMVDLYGDDDRKPILMVQY